MPSVDIYKLLPLAVEKSSEISPLCDYFYYGRDGEKNMRDSTTVRDQSFSDTITIYRVFVPDIGSYAKKLIESGLKVFQVRVSSRMCKCRSQCGKDNMNIC
ncbi:hypothetical protein CMV_003746 [Castanea mollissima]|uniref:Uncharacterized protein n=1 Tax=Castanea mollissima TaxID=60419 RepID=A0A8J4W2S5_9ROSI|nr:hypothetical protein CMV_003746 [Castanea mollissima]